MELLRLGYRKYSGFLTEPVSIAPLVTFRIAFGVIMLFSTLRYLFNGWVEAQLLNPVMHFHYYGFDWVQVLPAWAMYSVFALLAIASVGIAIGSFYRISTVLFFLCFTYVELTDLTYYLNHYYFVSIASFLLILVPAHAHFSWDSSRGRTINTQKISRWCVLIFKVQIAIVYIYAGLAKINYDWLILALPLKIWLPAKTSIPVIGFIFKYSITPYIFSWAGMLFDTFIIVFLLIKRTRIPAYILVVFFHLMTGILFQIGIFPLVMILVVTIFFSDEWHERIQNKIAKTFSFRKVANVEAKEFKRSTPNTTILFITAFFLFQLLFPWRYLLFPGNLFWTEEGYRFSWRVMLMEKAGTATFYVRDGDEGREGSVINREFLNGHQEKQMAMQPDMILQFAHYLETHFKGKGMDDPQVRAEVWVTLNARPAQLLIDPEIDLTKVKDSWAHKEWILPFNQNSHP